MACFSSGIASSRPCLDGRRRIDETSKIAIVSAEVSSRLALRTVDLGLLETRRNGRDDFLCDLVLQLEDVVERASKRSAQRCAPVLVSMSWPVIRIRLAGLTHAAFENVTNAQLAADLS